MPGVRQAIFVVNTADAGSDLEIVASDLALQLAPALVTVVEYDESGHGVRSTMKTTFMPPEVQET